jgi:hypothetical protein
LSFIILSIILAVTLPGTDAETLPHYFDKLSRLSISSLIFDIKYYTVLPSRFFSYLFINMNASAFSYNKYSLAIYSLMFMFVIFGISKNIKKDYVYVLYILITLPVNIFFSNRQGFRLIMPIFPFFIYFLFVGLSQITLSFAIFQKYNPVKIKVHILFGLVTVLISLFYISYSSYQNITYNKSGLINGPFNADSIELYDYIRANTKEDDAVIFSRPTVITLFTNRKSARIYELDNILNSHAEYIVCEKKRKKYYDLVHNLRKDYDCIFENDSFILCSLRNNSN